MGEDILQSVPYGESSEIKRIKAGVNLVSMNGGDSSYYVSMSNLTSFKKPYKTLPVCEVPIFRVEKDPARLIEKEINNLMANQRKGSIMPTETVDSMTQSVQNQNQLLNLKLIEDQQQSHSRMNKIIKKKI